MVFKHVLLKAQEYPIPMHRKSTQHSRGMARAPDGVQKQKMCTEGRSQGEITETTAPVSEALETIARTQ